MALPLSQLAAAYTMLGSKPDADGYQTPPDPTALNAYMALGQNQTFDGEPIYSDEGAHKRGSVPTAKPSPAWEPTQGQQIDVSQYNKVAPQDTSGAQRLPTWLKIIAEKDPAFPDSNYYLARPNTAILNDKTMTEGDYDVEHHHGTYSENKAKLDSLNAALAIQANQPNQTLQNDPALQALGGVNPNLVPPKAVVPYIAAPLPKDQPTTVEHVKGLKPQNAPPQRAGGSGSMEMSGGIQAHIRANDPTQAALDVSPDQMEARIISLLDPRTGQPKDAQSAQDLSSIDTALKKYDVYTETKAGDSSTSDRNRLYNKYFYAPSDKKHANVLYGGSWSSLPPNLRLQAVKDWSNTIQRKRATPAGTKLGHGAKAPTIGEVADAQNADGRRMFGNDWKSQ